MRPRRARSPLVPAPRTFVAFAVIPLLVLLAALITVPVAIAFVPPASPVPGDSGLWINRPLLAVEIQGLRRTRSRVVLRELSARVGAPLDWNRLERDRLRLLDLGLFASVTFLPRRDRDRDCPILEVRVQERPDSYALPTLSWEEGHGFTYGASVATLNLGGMARAVWIDAGTGARSYAQAGCSTRWAFGRRLGLSAQGSLRRRRNLSQGTVERHTGISAGIAPARGSHLSFPLGLGWAKVHAQPDEHPAPDFTGAATPRRDDHRWIEIGARIDTRDYRARPRRGEVLAVRGAANGGVLGGSVAMERYALDAMLVRPTGAAVFTVASRTVISRGGVPSFLRLDLGGASDLRGHRPDVYQGNDRWSGWVEERFPLLPRLEVTMPAPFSNTLDLTVDGAVFVDAGAIGSRGDWARGRVRGRWGAGAGLRLVLPFAGLLSLDLATDGRRIEAHALAGPRF
jgi:outer membrane protein insertion porin family